MTTYFCPEGHKIIANGVPECLQCNLIATHYNAKTGEVFEWDDIESHNKACEELQDMMDEAFDNQYFSGGW